MALRRRNSIRRLPLFGTLEVRGDLRLKLLVANLRGQQYRRTTSSVTAQIERHALAAHERALIIGAVRVYVTGGCSGELAVLQTHGRAVGVEIDDDAVNEFQRLRTSGGRRTDEDDRFVRPDEAQPVVNLGNRAFGILEPH